MHRAAPQHHRPRRRVRKTSPRAVAPSQALLFGALAGLLGVAAATNACSSSDGINPVAASTDETPAPAATDDAGTGPADAAVDPTYNFTVSDTPVTFEDFLAACTERDGYVQTTAACAGNNACRGFSYIAPTLTEHSCKGLNGCGPGMSCVALPKDGGLTGREIYEAGHSCGPTCHAQFSPSYDPSIFTLYVRPGTLSLDDAAARFKDGSAQRLYSIVAFGVHGVNDDGIAYANMPAYHDKYSRAEIERVVAYIRTLTLKPQLYEIVGAPGAGGSGGAMGP